MLILIAILITLLSPAAVLALSFSRLRTGYMWLLCTISTFFAWGLVILSRNQIPISIPLANWQSDYILFSSPSLLVDNISWPFAIVMMTLPLAALLTDITRVDKPDPQTWASIQALGGVGLVAVIAGNPLSMLLAWAVIDISECAVLLFRVIGSSERERVVISFSVRIAGMVVLISAILRAYGLGTPLTFENIPVEVGGYLMLAGGLRLGVLPPNQPHLHEPHMRRSLGTLVRFVPIAASIVLLVRAAHVEITGIWLLIFMFLSTLSAILSGIAWAQGKNELQARPFWILGFSSFALAAAVQGLPVASASWGLAMLLSGSLLFLFSTRHRWLLILPVLGAIGFSALPFTPTWEGTALFNALPWWYRVFFLAALSLLVIGYLRYAWQPRSSNQDFERWMWLIYPFGLAILPLTHFGLTYAKWMLGFQEIFFYTSGWWWGLVSLGLSALIMIFGIKRSISVPRFIYRLSSVFDWFYQVFWGVYRGFGRFLYLVTRLLEGEGGILWALLILILLIVSLNLWNSGDNLGL